MKTYFPWPDDFSFFDFLDFFFFFLSSLSWSSIALINPHTIFIFLENLDSFSSVELEEELVSVSELEDEDSLTFFFLSFFSEVFSFFLCFSFFFFFSSTFSLMIDNEVEGVEFEVLEVVLVKIGGIIFDNCLKIILLII